MAPSMRPKGAPVPPSAVIGSAAGGGELTEEKPPEDFAEAVQEEAVVVGLKLGTTLIKWVPWPHCTEEQ